MNPYLKVAFMVTYILGVTVLSTIFIPWAVPRLGFCFLAGMYGPILLKKLDKEKVNESAR